MLVGVAVLAVITPAPEPGENRADAAPAAQSAADASAPRFALVPVTDPTAAVPLRTTPSATDPAGLTRARAGLARAGLARAGLARAGLARNGLARAGLPRVSRLPTRSRVRSAASRSAARTPVRPPLVAQRFTHSTAAKRSALAQTAKQRPRPRVVPSGATGPGPGTGRGTGRAHRSWDRHGDRTGSSGSARRDSDDGSGASHGMSAVIAYAWAQVGKPYVMGSDGPGAFDCSGLTMQAYRRAGIMLPHSSGGQASMARTVSRAEARPGDLVVGPGHIGIYLGDGMMIDAGNSRVGVVYRPMYAGLHIERL